MNCEKRFSSGLLSWNRNENIRQMPWKGETDPYKIWISEIILQQTRVAQGLAYYQRFIDAFPDVNSLALAPQEKIFKLWEGLGYYSRCRNLIAAAKHIHENFGGRFPEKYEEILALKGIGTYTAAAICSFAFNQAFAVLDGNVYRVLSRFFGVETAINSNIGKKYFASLSQRLLNKKNPGEYNQAIMDFGAVICKPAAPLCAECPLQKNCLAFLENKVSFLPVNEKKIRQRKRFFNYLIIEFGNQFYLKERTEKDIWQNLHEFVLIESGSFLEETDLLKEELFLSILKGTQFEINAVSKIYSQKLTHQAITGRFFHVSIKEPLKNAEKKYKLVSKEAIQKLAFPKFIASYLKDKNVSLNLV